MRNSILRIGIVLVGILYGVTVSGQTVTSQNTYGEDKWIGHVYSNKNLSNYQGYLIRADTFIDLMELIEISQ